MQQLIDGVGDEVIQFTAVVVIVIVAVLAWWSTNARQDRYRTVLVMRSRSHHSVTVNIRTRSSLMLTSSEGNSSISIPTSNEVEDMQRDNSRVVPFQEMDSIVDADVAMLDNNRLHFYRRIAPLTTTVQNTTESASEESETQDESEPVSNAQIREMDSIVNAMEAEDTTGCDFFTRSNSSNATAVAVKENSTDGSSTTQANSNIDTNDTPNEGGNASVINSDNAETRILIKLKYLNDTLKEVEGNLNELLKDFKTRHFSRELSSESCVRLIFKGRVLVDDGATLEACGLHHEAVVHCLVHPKRTGNQHRDSPEETSGNVTHELITERQQPDRTWELENVLMTLVSVSLTVVWFFRCEYSNMFTASASVALLGLTVFYSVAIFGLYLSDTFQFERRPAPPQAVPNN